MFQINFVRGFGLLAMIAGVAMGFLQEAGSASGGLNPRYLLITGGILCWFIGNKLAEMEGRTASPELPASTPENSH